MSPKAPRFDPDAWVISRKPPHKGPTCSLCPYPELCAAIRAICERWADGAPNISWVEIAEEVVHGVFGIKVGPQTVQRHVARDEPDLWARLRGRLGR